MALANRTSRPSAFWTASRSFTQQSSWHAPKACDLMADWGADVTWLENTGAGDTIRDTAYVKQAERRNQRSVSMNYFSDEGKEILFKMLADADVFIEASKGGTWARKGITDEVLWEINPKLVIVHLSGFGQSGDPKMVKRAAYDLTVMAYSGYHEPERHAGAADAPRTLRWATTSTTLMIVSSTLAALHKAETARARARASTWPCTRRCWPSASTTWSTT